MSDGYRCARPTQLQVPFDIHALVQYAHDPNTFVLGHVKDNVRLMLKPPQSRRELIGLAPKHRVFRKHLVNRSCKPKSYVRAWLSPKLRIVYS